MGGGVVPYIEFLMVEFSELAEHRARLPLVLAHSAGEGIGTGGTDRLLVVGDISDKQGAKLRDQLQPQRVPQPEHTRTQRETYQGGYTLDWSPWISFT